MKYFERKCSFAQQLEANLELWSKTACNSHCLFFLWRAFKALYQADSRVRAEIDSWPDELTLHMQASRSGPDLYLRKTAGGLERLKVCAAADVEIQFKCLDEAFQLVTGQLGVARAYAEHRLHWQETLAIPCLLYGVSI